MFLQDVAQKARNRPSELQNPRSGKNLFCPQDAAPNLLLAAGTSVGHIRQHGAVAEWLKAAVC
jgi:hypothetical protein